MNCKKGVLHPLPYTVPLAEIDVKVGEHFIWRFAYRHATKHWCIEQTVTRRGAVQRAGVVFLGEVGS